MDRAAGRRRRHTPRASLATKKDQSFSRFSNAPDPHKISSYLLCIAKRQKRYA